MRKSSLTLLAAVIGLAASQASAADLPRKAPVYVPPAPPPITWTGCYIGGNVGGDICPPLGGFRFFWITRFRHQFWLCWRRSNWLRLSIRRRMGARLPQYV